MATTLTFRRALLSVSDKTGLDILARFLHDDGAEIISTGGTATAIEALGIPVTRVEDVTGFPEIMDGRVKTLHPKIHAGLLARRDLPDHVGALVDHEIKPIDLLVVNLYPFEKTVANPDVSLEDAIENIDIGGPAMIRAAAKNHEHVAVVTDPSQYADLIEDYGRDDCCTPEFRRRLAAAAFARTAAYDAAITNYLFAREDDARPIGSTEADDAGTALPWKLALPLTKVRSLRYGENPHQDAGVYALDGPQFQGNAEHRVPDHARGLAFAPPLHGKPLSYNNLLDANASLALARELFALDPSRHAAVVVKHTNPCGAAVADSALACVDGALAGDPLAAYGGILATTSRLDRDAAERLAARGTFLEVIIAAGFEDEAMDVLTRRSKSVRLLEVEPRVAPAGTRVEARTSLRAIDGGFLVQTCDTVRTPTDEWTLAAGEAADDATLGAAEIVWTICKHLSSNAIAIGGPDPEREGRVRLFGAGAGQMDRVASCRIAVEKAGERAAGAIAASDAFFPFPDGPGILADAGIRAIVHPGGSKRDAETFDLCRERGVACYTTGVRHFRH